jgi:hypothetical protein
VGGMHVTASILLWEARRVRWPQWRLGPRPLWKTSQRSVRSKHMLHPHALRNST